MKKLLVAQVVEGNEQLDKKRPTLVRGEEGCGAPKRLCKDTDLIKSVCSQLELRDAGITSNVV